MAPKTKFPGLSESTEERNVRCAGLTSADCSAGFSGDARTKDERLKQLAFLENLETTHREPA